MARSGYKDYWKILQVSRGADQATIKQAFRRLARQHHPDVKPNDKAAEARFKEINEAYEVLSDPEKRRRYEQFGRFWSGDHRQASGGAGVDMDFQNYGNFDEFISDLLGRLGEGNIPGGFSASGFPRPGRSRSRPLDLDAETALEISFAEAFHGCERTLAVRTFGKNQESVQVRIPAGILPATRLRLKGKGNLQPGTGRRGDLYLRIRLKPHPVWRLEGDQLKADLGVGLDEAVLGGEIEVPTPNGTATVTVPAGIQPGHSLRLRGQGWPSSGGRKDLLLTVVIAVPQSPSPEELALLRQWAACRTRSPREAMAQQALLPKPL
ncbi:MAG: molecular chaperone DnaJ [Candidatus Synechococcus spongiarum SP3]|uniref:Molecular chaperone DnaJ n=1 Tax=Candidatus Synechococcus spongiarum SP3 TaxID=1604020 RepID=A0A0G2IWP2_9SYNE|nr:MAG: molecular chaperone DnaJ [Candidatus Synechococcus spongiarum SP3]